MKNEVIAVIVFLASLVLMGNGVAAAPVSGIGTSEIYLVFALVFTFAVGLEVVK